MSQPSSPHREQAGKDLFTLVVVVVILGGLYWVMSSVLGFSGATAPAAAEHADGMPVKPTGAAMADDRGVDGFRGPQDKSVMAPTPAPLANNGGKSNDPKSASSSISASAAGIKADLSTSLATITTPTQGRGVMPEDRASIVDDLKAATKGDGQLRRVKVDGSKIGREMVHLAMFENQDFNPRLEAPSTAGQSRPNLQDPSQTAQKSFFRKMVPMGYEWGTLAGDQVHSKKDAMATVSFVGGT